MTKEINNVYQMGKTKPRAILESALSFVSDYLMQRVNQIIYVKVKQLEDEREGKQRY